MGILYSHVVFQPPDPPTYTDEQGIFFFRKNREDSISDEHRDDDYLDRPLIYLHTSRGNTIPAAYFHQKNSYYTILFSHGNGEDLGVSATYAHELSKALKTSVFTYDYSGYGLADGKSSEVNCYSDIRAAYTFLIGEKRIPPHRIILFGRSLGSGPTLDLAATLGSALGGVVLIGGLTSCVRVVFNNLNTTLKFDMFPNIDKIDKVIVPVFCVHGMLDNVVPFEHGLELSRRARYPVEPLWVRGAGHNNLESSRFQKEVFGRYQQVLQEFRSWRRPEGLDGATQHIRRDSSGPLTKAIAGCFLLPRDQKHAADGRHQRHNTAPPPSRTPRSRRQLNVNGDGDDLDGTRRLAHNHGRTAPPPFAGKRFPQNLHRAQSMRHTMPRPRTPEHAVRALWAEMKKDSAYRMPRRKHSKMEQQQQQQPQQQHQQLPQSQPA